MCIRDRDYIMSHNDRCNDHKKLKLLNLGIGYFCSKVGKFNCTYAIFLKSLCITTEITHYTKPFYNIFRIWKTLTFFLKIFAFSDLPRVVGLLLLVKSKFA